MAFTQDELPAAGSFASQATDEAGHSRDLADWLLNQRHLQGTVSPSLGFTKPYNRDAIGSLADVFSFARGWQQEQQARKGGSEYDTLSTPDDDTYRQRRFDFISKEEGVVPQAYPDIKGIRTIGIGFNMDRPDAGMVLGKVLGLDAARYQKLRDGQDQLQPNEIRRLFDYNVQEAESIVNTKFKDVNLTEHQRLALVSMAFNSPSLIGPKITAAIRNGDTKSALQEILFNSNAEKNKGLAGRRYREAFAFAGNDPKAMPDFKGYMKDYA